MSTPSRTVSARLSMPEYEKLAMEASAAGMTLGSFVRYRLTGEVASTPSNTQALYSRLETVEKRLTGLTDAINSGQGILGPKEEG